MKTKDLKELRSKKPVELEKMLVERKLTILKLQANTVAGKEKNLKKASNLRRELAQISTIKGELEIIEKESKK